MNAGYTAALSQIETAELSLAEYRTARRLLDLAPNTGYLDINRECAMQLCGTSAWGTVRRQLIALQNVGIIEKWLNHSTRVWFKAYPPPAWKATEVITPRAEVITTRAEVITFASPEALIGDETTDDAGDGCSPDDQIRALRDHFRACGDQIRAPRDHFDPPTYTHASAQGVELGWVESTDQNPTEDLQDQTQPNSTQTVDPTGQAWSFDLLTDPAIGLMRRNARTVSERMLPGEILRYVADWWTSNLYTKPDSPQLKPGLLAWRLMHSEESAPAPVSAQFVDSELYRRHYASLEVLDDAPEWVWSLPEPPRPVEFQNADGEWVTLVSGGGRP